MEAGSGWKHSLRDGCCPFLGLFPSHAQADNLQLLQGEYFTSRPSNRLLEFSTKKTLHMSKLRKMTPTKECFLESGFTELQMITSSCIATSQFHLLASSHVNCFLDPA